MILYTVTIWYIWRHQHLSKVRDIIAACRQDRAIELVVSRDSALAGRRREGLGEADLTRWNQNHSCLPNSSSNPAFVWTVVQNLGSWQYLIFTSRPPFHPLEPRNMGCRLQVRLWQSFREGGFKSSIKIMLGASGIDCNGGSIIMFASSPLFPQCNPPIPTTIFTCVVKL